MVVAAGAVGDGEVEAEDVEVEVEDVVEGGGVEATEEESTTKTHRCFDHPKMKKDR